mmetsp:Transcript_14154/g.34337  ORF Transcript_14154/g.34337 Transcript_14154/m.34337 type:complete len:552 (+) Transcript_14154:94-1749(+)
MVSSISSTKSPPRRFLFLQLLLLSSCYIRAESSALSSDPSNHDVYTRGDITAPTTTADLPRISLNLRASSKSKVIAEEETSPQTNVNVTNSNNGSNDNEEDSEGRQLGYTDLYRTPIQVPTNSSSSSSSSSDRKNNMFRIVGGSNHDASGMPNFAMLLSKSRDDYFYGGCGGSLISPCHILTAAHCADDPNSVANMGVYVNAYNPWGDNNGLPGHFSTVEAYAIHPYYTNQVNTRPQHDVAVLTLSKCVDQNEQDKDLFLHNIMELATPDDWYRLTNGAGLKVSGFGSSAITGIGGTSNSYTDILRTVQVPFQAQCSRQNFYSAGLVQDNDMMCAGSGGRDACFGDSGGPLYYEYSSTPTRHSRRKQYGVVSWGHGCGLANKPGVYASVAHHYDYIKGIVCSNPNVQMMASNWASSNMCGNNRQEEQAPRPTKPPTPPPTGRPTSRPTQKPTPGPTPKPTRSPTFAPTGADGQVYTFDNGSTAERKERSGNNAKQAQKLSGGSYVSSISRIRGGSANKPMVNGGGGNGNGNNGNGRRRQLGALPDGPEEAS